MQTVGGECYIIDIKLNTNKYIFYGNFNPQICRLLLWKILVRAAWLYGKLDIRAAQLRQKMPNLIVSLKLNSERLEDQKK